MTECIFCKIIAGELPCHKVYGDDDVIAFLDINPVHAGHTLVVSKKHAQTLDALEDANAQKLFAAVKTLSKKITQAMGTPHYRIQQNNGTPAGQVVPHVHVHVLPFYEADEPADKKDFEKIVQMIEGEGK